MALAIAASKLYFLPTTFMMRGRPSNELMSSALRLSSLARIQGSGFHPPEGSFEMRRDWLWRMSRGSNFSASCEMPTEAIQLLISSLELSSCQSKTTNWTVLLDWAALIAKIISSLDHLNLLPSFSNRSTLQPSTL